MRRIVGGMSYLSTAVLALSLAIPTINAFPAVPTTSHGIVVSAVSAVQKARTVYLGPDGEPLPFESDEAIVDFLITSDIIERTRIDEGINRTWKLLMEKDGVRAHAIFREVDIIEENKRVSPIFFPLGDSYIFDCAAYEMAVLLGMDNVPPAVLRGVARTPGCVQLWVEGAHRVGGTDFRPPNTQDWVRQLWTMSLFDALIYNVDRNTGNLMVDDHYKLWLIDHGRGFQRKSDPFNIDKVEMVDRRIWERLRELDEATISAAMGDYLDSEQVVSLMARHRKLVY